MIETLSGKLRALRINITGRNSHLNLDSFVPGMMKGSIDLAALKKAINNKNLVRIAPIEKGFVIYLDEPWCYQIVCLARGYQAGRVINILKEVINLEE